MPELPEIAAHAERLSASHGGATLTRFEPLSFTALKTVDPPPEAAHGKRLDRVEHRGKHLLLRFGALTFVVHLMQGGRLRVDSGTSRRPRGGVARWVFEEHDPLLMTEAGSERRAGVWLTVGDPLSQPPLDQLGPDADAIDEAELGRLFAAHPMRLHGFLRDQRILAGIGRLLANEVCHRARCSPFARTGELAGDAGRIRDAIQACVAEGLQSERERGEMGAAADRPARVHGRTGEPCPDCGDLVRAVEYRDYTVNYCARCQTGGRILADNALSRLGVARAEQGVRRRRKP